MDTGINIQGASPDADGVKALTDGIAQVFRVAAETRMDQSTVLAALEIVGRIGGVHGTMISDTQVDGGKSVHLHIDAESFQQ